MIELLRPSKINSWAYDNNKLNEIKKYSKLPGHRIGWNYPMDYSWVAMQMEQVTNEGFKPKKCLDIGCGPGAIHGYLERTYDIDILGIDKHRWSPDYVDITGDLLNRDLRERNNLNDFDLIISASSVEHNPPEKQKEIIDLCRSLLNPDGKLIITAAFSNIQSYENGSTQWNLSSDNIDWVYGESVSKDEFESVLEEWRNDERLSKAYSKRYNTTSKVKFVSFGYASSTTPPTRGVD